MKKKESNANYNTIVIKLNNFLRQSDYSRNYILSKVRLYGGEIFQIKSSREIILDFAEFNIVNPLSKKSDAEINEYIRLADLDRLTYILCRKRQTKKYYSAIKAIVRYRMWVNTQYGIEIINFINFPRKYGQVEALRRYKMWMNLKYGIQKK